MKIGFVGCGKLGLMAALTIESRGHEVAGYDLNYSEIKGYLETRRIPFQEENSDILLSRTKMKMMCLSELCEWADILFLAPQTPHAPEYEGVTRLPDTRVDFDYTYLENCVLGVVPLLNRPKICIIISTVLPGTIEKRIQPLLSKNFRLVYSPQFIAMGTVYEDLLNPEFWLLGGAEKDVEEASKFFNSIAFVPMVKTDIRTAEGIKVFYNTFITAKTVLANLYGEMSHRLGMNVDDIFQAVAFSGRRLLSSKYLRAGMGDGGGCHPRDNIALSWLARECGLSFDFFESLMMARENHCAWLADLIAEHQNGLPIVILGRSFKPETNIETGSPSILLSNCLKARGIYHICEEDYFGASLLKGLYFIGTQHKRYRHYKFASGSIVIDPFRYIPVQNGVSVIQIGAGKFLAKVKNATELATV